MTVVALSIGSEETAPERLAENTVKHHYGGAGSMAANHCGGSESSVVVKTVICRRTSSTRVVGAWNSLPNWVVSANNINAFKKDLISTGNIKILYTIFEPKLKELEAVVRF